MGIVDDILRVARKKWRSWGLIKKGIASIVALFLVFVILGGIIAIVSPSAKETVTPTPAAATAAATATPSGQDPLLSAIATKIQSTESANNPTITWGTAGFTVHELWHNKGVEYEYVRSASFLNDVTTANATAEFNNFTTTTAPNGGAEKVVDDGHETHFAQSEVTAALGHTPTAIKDITWHYSGQNVAFYEAIQYDNVVVWITQALHINDPSAPVTP